MPLDPPTAPDYIGPYRLDSLLAKGGMGEVYRGYDDRLKRAVALKRVRPGRRPEAARRLRREARAVAQLRHDAIIRIHDWVEDGNDLWLVMELVEGRSLRQVLTQDGRLSPAATARLGRQLAEGLAVAHDAGVIHRDLKPDNIMITPDDGLRILDFGLVKPIDESQTTSASMSTSISAEGEILGTVHYMSPEQAVGDRLDERSDLFSLGCVLYEAASGEPPFQAANAVKTLHRLCNHRQLPLAQNIPGTAPELSDLVDRLLEKQRHERPRTAHLVAEILSLLEERLEATDWSQPPPIAEPVDVHDTNFTTDALVPPITPPRHRLFGIELWLFGVATLLGVLLIWWLI